MNSIVSETSVHLTVYVNYRGDTAPSPSNCTTESSICSFRSAVATCSDLYANNEFAECHIVLPSDVLSLCDGFPAIVLEFPTAGAGTFTFVVVGTGSAFQCIGTNKQRFLSISSSNQSANLVDVILYGFNVTGFGREGDANGVLSITGAHSVRLSGLSFAYNSNSYGCIHMSASSNVVFSDSVFNGNNDTALVVSDSSDVRISGVRFEDSTADCGGAIRLDTGNKNITIDSITATNNRAVNGGGIYIGTDNTNITLRNCNISGNMAQHGGGVYVSSRNDRISIIDCNVSHNIVSSKGAGVYVDQYNNYMTISSSNISNNYADFGGGSIYINQYNSYMSIVDCIMVVV